jgi:hypothetical protein
MQFKDVALAGPNKIVDVYPYIVLETSIEDQ